MAVTLTQIFNSFKVSPKDLKMYKRILRGTGEFREEKVIDHFMKNYVYKLNTVFGNSIKNVLNDLISTDTTSKQFTKETIGFKATSKKYKDILKDDYEKVAPLVLDSFFKRNNIKNMQLRKQLKDSVYDEFNSFIKDAMNLTERDVLNDIRTIQREVIQNTLKTKELKGIPDLNSFIEKEKKGFKKKILKKYPNIKNKLEEGKVLKSKPWKDQNGNIRTMTYTLNNYTDMSIEASIMNTETTTGVINAEQRGQRVVEYYLANNRQLKTGPFPYCQEILRKRIKGKALLALDEEAADILGIPTVATARANGALDRKRRCRHSVRPIENENYNTMINKLLYAGNLTIGQGE